jgi:DNA-binding response OmpR family regulator
MQGDQPSTDALRSVDAPRRVLVVEDETLVGLDLALALVEEGFEVVGPARDLATALALVSHSIDAAVLDINIGGQPVWPVALRLQALGKPVLFVSGYGPEVAAPPALADLPRLQKPVTSKAVARGVKVLLGEDAEDADGPVVH